MRNSGRRGCLVLVISCLLACTPAMAQPKQTPAQNPTVQSEEDVSTIRQQVIELLRLNPKSAAIFAHDPTLLSDPQYVARNNPQLATFLQSHPEVARNPEFYLFANVPPGRGSQAIRLEGEVWPELGAGRDWRGEVFANDVVPFMVFVLVLLALLWLVRTLLEHRRWNRTFHVQAEIYGKLLEKFANNEELMAYMQSEAGKRFLASATLPQVPEGRGTNAIARVLTPLQIGAVMTLAGCGFLYLQHDVGGSIPLLGLGTLAVALGLGFMISAGLAWVLARRIGILGPASGQAEAPIHQENGL